MVQDERDGTPAALVALTDRADRGCSGWRLSGGSFDQVRRDEVLHARPFRDGGAGDGPFDDPAGGEVDVLVTRGRFRHLGFSEGMHGCLGATLARLEAKVAVEESLPVLGDHIDLVLRDDLVRQYSLCGDPTDQHTWRIGVLRVPESRGGSIQVHDRLREGDRVRIRGPRNHFALAAAERYLFSAGGIGFTPILTMIAQAENSGADWQLVYGGRRAGSMAHRDELAGHGAKVTIWPQDEQGVIDLSGLLGKPRPGTLVYTCGPGPLLDAVETHCASWPKGSLHLERFVAKPLTEPVLTDAFEIELARSGLTLTVPPESSILDVVEAAGVPVLSSCAEGTRGTCETAVLDGVRDHRNAVPSEDERAENSCLMICVSGPPGPDWCWTCDRHSQRPGQRCGDHRPPDRHHRGGQVPVGGTGPGRPPERAPTEAPHVARREGVPVGTNAATVGENRCSSERVSS